MRRLITNLSVCVIALTLVVPPSYARRLGGGRSTGRQTQMMRQRSPAPMQRQQVAPAAPPVAQQRTAPLPAPPLAAPRPGLPPAPVPNVARPASRPWGGMLGGALVGLGLGSLLSSGDRNSVNQNANQNPANPNGAGVNPDGTVSGTGLDGTTAAGNGAAGSAQPAEQRQGIFSHPFLLALLALVGFLFIRRARRRALQR